MFYEGDADLCVGQIIEGIYEDKTRPDFIDTTNPTPIKHQTSLMTTFKPKTPIEERMRKENSAVGIENVGNTCFASVLFQIYYSLPGFVE